MLAQMSFDIEQTLIRQPSTHLQGPHVYVMGLARSGTTILMRSLYQTGEFRSLTYRDMPFVLMPNIWAKLSGMLRKNKKEEERAHGDRIKVNYDSPEAFEEVFWRIFCSQDYVRENFLQPHDVDDDTLDNYRKYIACIVSSSESEKQTRYLSKNNNSILRLNVIKKAFPEASIIVPFRDPLQHAMSMHRQHLKFCELHRKDSFALKYMSWLGHYEFGLDHKPFKFSSDSNNNDLAAVELEYWVDLWTETYDYLLTNAPNSTIYFSYEELCAHPKRVLDALGDQIGVSGCSVNAENIQIVETKNSPQLNRALKDRAYEIYGKLTSRI